MSFFRRAQSKVFYGNSLENPYQSIYSSIDREIAKTRQTIVNQGSFREEKSNNSIDSNGNDDSWSSNRQGSPSSHKSQDSGFSDAEHSHHLITLANSSSQSNASETPKKGNSSNSSHLKTPSSASSVTIVTPPTVIRRPKVNNKELLHAKQISFNDNSNEIQSKINELSFENTSPIANSSFKVTQSNTDSPKIKLRRSKPITKCENSSVRKSLLGCLPPSADNDNVSWEYRPSADEPQYLEKSYHNETITFGGPIPQTTPEDNNNNSINLPLPTYLELFPSDSSTPKRSTPITHRSMPKQSKRVRQTPGHLKAAYLRSPPQSESKTARSPSPDDFSSIFLSSIHFNEYTNPLLNGHALPVQIWLDETRNSCYNEVMSTLQTKSLIVEASRNTKIASITAVRIIRNLQLKVTELQSEFERSEKELNEILLNSDDETDDVQAKYVPCIINPLVGSIGGILEKVIAKNIYQADNEKDLEKFEDTVDNILDMASDLRKAAGNVDDLDIVAIKEDVQILKRYLLICIRSIFEKLIKIIVQNIEDSKSHLILKSNLNYIATLSNLDYTGFGSLNDAFCSNGTVRALLIVCLEEKQASIRALALRALATVCSSPETIAQFEQSDGLEIVKETLIDTSPKRTEQEMREAISILTQITAPWHGPNHQLENLKCFVDPLVESITRILAQTPCCQTLLLCAACLNNLSRLESTAIYSIMSNETISKLNDACNRRGLNASIFLYEQITSMIFNMALNKKSHHHLADKTVINFMTHIFEDRFYAKYSTRAENQSLQKVIKNLLHIFSRLIHESNMGHEILANNMVPIFSRIEGSLVATQNEFSRDLSYISRKLNESLTMPVCSRYLESNFDAEHESKTLSLQQETNDKQQKQSYKQISFV
uniref:CSON004920 protein n=1 Tax=Culicoides sonorensis TaxID=179676 RepID=A0A336L696_CULSO